MEKNKEDVHFMKEQHKLQKLRTKRLDMENIIEIEESTELISDEYAHEPKKNLSVFIFNGDTSRENVDYIVETFNVIGVKIKSSRIYKLNKLNSVQKDLDKISKKNHSQVKCLIVIVLGTIPIELSTQVPDGRILPLEEQPMESKCLDIKDVWSTFIHCYTLKNVPKIFLFQIAVSNTNRIAIDGGIVKTPDCGIPVAADLFVVYKKIDFHNRYKFIHALCERIKLYYKREDIFELVTHCERIDGNPLILISTLTKKSYLTEGRLRGYYYDIECARFNFQEKLNQINKILIDLGKRMSLMTMIRSCPTLSEIPSSSTESLTTGSFLRPRSNTSSRSRRFSKTSVENLSKKPPWK